MRELSEIRDEIDKIDAEIVRLFEKRMDLTTDVASYKIKVGKPVFDQERERAKISSVQSLTHSDITAQGVKELFEHIMFISRTNQYQLLTQSDPSNYSIFDALPSVSLKNIPVYVKRGLETLATDIYPEINQLQIIETEENLLDILEQNEHAFGLYEIPADDAVFSCYNQIANHNLCIVQCHYMDHLRKKRVVLLSARKLTLEGAKQITLCFEASHECGSLYHLLLHLIYNRINLNRIGSMICSDNPKKYRFFIDMEGDESESSVQNAILGLKGEAQNFSILGIY